MKIFSKNAFLFAAVIAASTLARANDSAIEGAGGSPIAIGSIQKVQPLKGEHRSIRMLRETVDMTLGEQSYEVIANFVFRNEGAATTVLMGFPEGAGGDIDFGPLEKRSAYRNFATWVDGRRAPVRRIVAKQAEYDFDFDAYWVKSVRFARGQTRRVRVSYRAPVGTSVGFDYIYYDFTGGNWKGKVADSRLTIKLATPGVYRLYPVEEHKSATRWQKGNTLFWQWRNWQAQDGFAFRFGRTLPNIIARANEEKDLNEDYSFFGDTREIMVQAPNRKPSIWDVHLTYTPDCILRDGRAFVSVRGLSDAIRNQISERERTEKKKQRYGEMRWNEKTQTTGLVVPAAPGQSLPERVLMFRANLKEFTLNEKAYALPAASFVAGGVGEKTLYVPLAPVIRALNGQLKYNAKTRHVWFAVPI
jgi:hypothetical protein